MQRFSYALKAFNYICNAKLAADNFLAISESDSSMEMNVQHWTKQTDLYITACKNILCTELQVPEKVEIKKQNNILYHINSIWKCSILLSESDSYS